MSAPLSVQEKLGPCPKCGGKAMVDCLVQSPYGLEQIDVRCIRCGLMMKYEYNIFEPQFTSIMWIYNTEERISVLDAWKPYKEVWHETN